METKEFTIEFTGLWRQVGDSIVNVHSRIDARFDGIDARLDGIDARLDGIDGRLDGIDGRLDRMELANERRFSRIDAQLERLVAYVVRDETTTL
jgi:hypothetical protein